MELWQWYENKFIGKLVEFRMLDSLFGPQRIIPYDHILVRGDFCK
jgi:hypothetical protein